MAAALVRPLILRMPAPTVGLVRGLRRLGVGSNFMRVPSCSLHTVVATEDPVINAIMPSSLLRVVAF